MRLETPAVTSNALPGESYADFQKRVAEDNERVREKIAGLDPHTPYCDGCGETVGPEKAGTLCEVNNAPMTSSWARERAENEFYRVSNFGGCWGSAVTQLACLLDRIWAEARSNP